MKFAVGHSLRTASADVAPRSAAAPERVWSALPQLLASFSSDGEIISANPAWQDLLGLSLQDVQGVRLERLLHAEDVPQAELAFKRIPVRGRAQFSGRLRHADGHFVRVVWALAKEGTGVIGSGRDAAPDCEAGDAHDLHDGLALRANDRLQAVCRLAGGIAHDVNNLLHTVRNSVELIGRGAADAAHVARRVELALRVIDNGSKLAEQMLAFAGTERTHVSPLPLAHELWRLRDELSAQLGPRVSLAIDPSCDNGSVRVDPRDLKAALMNLAANARDAMPQGGQFTLACRAAYLVYDSELPTGHYLKLTAADNGHGMTDAVREHALEPFFTTKDAGQARGMGLSQVYGFARQCGGTVRLASSGAGTVVSLLLPLAAPDQRDGRAALALA